MKTIKAHISTLTVGDTVLIDGIPITVCNNNLKQCGFMGTSFNGDASVKMLTLVVFPKFYKGELLGYFRQV